MMRSFGPYDRGDRDGPGDPDLAKLRGRIRFPPELRALESTAGDGEDDDALDRLRFYLQSDAMGRLNPGVRDAILRATRPEQANKRFALEAIVRTTGRPALPLRGGFIDPADPEAAAWGELLAFEDPIRKLALAVGRIDLGGVHIGTGFVVAHGVILTNRHVLEEIARAFRKGDGETWLFSAGEPAINFDAELGSRSSQRFRITGVLAAGPDAINGEIDFARLDAAALQVETTNDAGDPFPSSLVLAAPGSESATTAVKIVSLGCPGAPTFSPAGPTPTPSEVEILAALKRIFNYRYGVKRLSPGRIMETAGRLAGDSYDRVFTHDASTLGGASGSVVAHLNGADLLVVGIHFGGEMLRQNYGVTAASMENSVLQNLQVSWGV